MECYDKKRFEPPVLKREKKIKALIDKFFPKEYKNTHAYKSALEIVEYSKF